MRIYKCDRCGKVFEHRPGGIVINKVAYTIKSGYSADGEIDLCMDCVREFSDWWRRVGKFSPDNVIDLSGDSKKTEESAELEPGEETPF